MYKHYTHTERDFMKLSHAVIGVSKSEIYGPVAGNSEVDTAVETEFLLETSNFTLTDFSIDWVGPTHIIKGNLLSLKSTDVMLTTSKKYL